MWPKPNLVISVRICNRWRWYANQLNSFDAPIVWLGSWLVWAFHQLSLPTRKPYDQTNMLLALYQTLDVPMINATLIRNALSSWPIRSKCPFHFDPKSAGRNRNLVKRIFWMLFHRLSFHIYLNRLITGTCRNSLTIIIVQHIVDDIFVLRSNFLRFKHPFGLSVRTKIETTMENLGEFWFTHFVVQYAPILVFIGGCLSSE